jgi:hypothetical protein
LTLRPGAACLTWLKKELGRRSDNAFGPTPDFDGDGSVGFRDFILFAQKFGSNEGDGTYESVFDLDSNAEVGFRDFILFAQFYGKDPSTFGGESDLS